MDKPKFITQRNGQFVETEFPKENITKYKYTKHFYESNEIPICNLCGSNLTFRQARGKREIRCCNNINCLSNKKQKGKDYKLQAFLPKELYEEIKKKRSEHNCNNLEYIISKGYSEEEAQNILNDLKEKQRQNGKNNKGNNKINYCKKHNITLDEYDKKLRQRNLLCIEYYLERGLNEETAKQKIFDIQSKNSAKVKNRYVFNKDELRKRGYSEDEILQFNRERSKWSKEFYLKRGFSEEEALIEINKIQSNNAKHITHEMCINSSKRRKEYYLLRGATEDEAIAAVKTYQTTFSKEICIKKYGEEKGLEIFNKRQKKWQESLFKNGNIKGGYSKISQECFNYIIDNQLCKFGNVENIRYATKNSEFTIQYKGKNFNYDFVDLDNKKIIEFNGDVYHGNPEFFDKDDYPHPYNKHERAKHIWARDKGKTKIANKFGFDVFVIWEYDWKYRKEQVIEQLKKFYGKENNRNNRIV